MSKKGFTLIEVLLIIAIIGAIMLLIVPKINDIYNDSKNNIYMESTNRMVKAFDSYFVRKNIGNTFSGCNYNFSTGVSSCDDFSFDGTAPSGGQIMLSKEGSVDGYVVFNGYIYIVQKGLVSLYEVDESAGNEFVFDYTGSVQTFNVPYYGNYKIELWGASGGNLGASFSPHVDANFGFGGYTSGVISLNKDEKLYVFVGQRGFDGVLGSTSVTSSAYNGGGAGAGSSDGDDAGGSGGGATDIRLVSGAWNDFQSLKSRIMVAGGGAGGNATSFSNSSERGGHGGGLAGVGTLYRWQDSVVSDLSLHATQTTGYRLGEGQAAVLGLAAAGSGGGGGYYGGLAQQNTNGYGSAGGGGSSYISGFEGCNSISNNSTENSIIHTGLSVHYSGRFFSDSVMKAGNEEMPTHDGTSTMIGNTGNGYAKITYLGLGV